MDSSTLSRLAGLAAFALMIARLGRLLESGADTAAWHLILLAAAFLGGVIWWLLNQTVNSRRLAIGLFAIAGSILFLRIAVPQSLIAGFFPGPETPGALATEISESIDIFRFGVTPVFPSAGLVASLAVILWVIGGLFVWGASVGPVAAMSIPSIAMYLQFAVIDRAPAGRGWMGAAVAVFALAVAAIANEQRSTAGRVRDADGRPMPRRGGSMALALAAVIAVASVAAASSAATVFSEEGNIQWRTGGGYGAGYGGTTFNRFVDLRQRVISRSNVDMFIATVDENAPPADQIYWRMESLDLYDGESWRPGPESPVRYSPAAAGGQEDHEYGGTSATFAQLIKIEDLRGFIVPTAGIAQRVQSDTEDINQFQVISDGSLIIQSQLDQGMKYQVQANYPLERLDVGALATTADGVLSPLFASAVEAGAVDLSPAPAPGVERPSDIDRFIELPEDTPNDLIRVARERTAGAQTDFERATLLQRWFRDSGDFEYSTEVSSGHDGLLLDEWLSDPESTNYRTGYCEQFAASMAVLGRVLGIPSRVVWGFTPGEQFTQSDGTQAIRVRDTNAHAWVEMWMDGFGWVRFDPTPRSDGALPVSFTAGFDASEFVADSSQQPDTIDQPGVFDEEGPRFGLDETDLGLSDGTSAGGLPLWILVFPIAGLLFLVVPVMKRFRRNRRLRQIRDGDVTAAWDEIVDQLRDLGEPIPAHQTPIEFAVATDRSLVPVATAYGAAIYGGREGQDSEHDFLAVEGWIKLRYEGGERMRARFKPGSLISRRRDSAS